MIYNHISLNSSHYNPGLQGIKMFWKIIYLIWILLEIDKAKSEDIFHPTARVTGMSPHDISNMGGVITINGENFAQDNFNQFDANLGNRVSIVEAVCFFRLGILQELCKNSVTICFL